MARIACKIIAPSTRAEAGVEVDVPVEKAAPVAGNAEADPLPQSAECRQNEPVTAFHSEAGGHQFANGGNPAGRIRGLPATAGIRSSTGGLSHHPGAHVLSR